MMRDERTRDLAAKYGVTAGRVSQWRREYQENWNHFHGQEEQPGERLPAGTA